MDSQETERLGNKAMTKTTAALLSLLAVGLSSNHQSNTYPKASLLIDARDLAKPEARSRYRILDTRSKGKYEAGHVPGAVRVDAAGWSKAFNADPAVNHWSKRVGELGIDLDIGMTFRGSEARGNGLGTFNHTNVSPSTSLVHTQDGSKRGHRSRVNI